MLLTNVLIFLFPERGKLADPFYRLEHQEEDLQKKKEAEPVLVRLQRVSDARHSDDYSLNKALRAQLRVCYWAHINSSFHVLLPVGEVVHHFLFFSESKEKSCWRRGCFKEKGHWHTTSSTIWRRCCQCSSCEVFF